MEMMTSHLLDWLARGVLGVLGFLAVLILKGIMNEIKNTRQSVDLLNVKMATIIEKTSNHEKQIDEHSERILSLEREVKP